MKKLNSHFNDFLELFFPSICLTCNSRLAANQLYVCFNCWMELPVTNFHLNEENKVAQLFWGRVKIENAAAFFSYKKGSNYQHLIHKIKYKGLKELGEEMGERYGHILKEAEGFKNIDVIFPVPLHPKKYKQRGFNQSEWIAKGIARAIEKPVNSENLFRKSFTSTQTRKTRFQRWENVEGIFGLKNHESIENKHILLIDDVVTTGSTLEACANELVKIEKTKVSIATLAFADF